VADSDLQFSKVRMCVYESLALAVFLRRRLTSLGKGWLFPRD
jgi:hypothetical protein